MGIIAQIMDVVAQWIEAIVGFIVDATEAVVGLFYTGTELTVVGVLALFGLAFTFVMFAFNFVKGLIKQ